MGKRILLLGTMDTKGEEFGYVKRKINEKGFDTLVLDAGVLGVPKLEADISNQEVALASGISLEAIIAQGKEGVALEKMIEGTTNLVQQLYNSSKINGILSLGGSMGTSLATAVMRSLPIGIPKLMVSTMASGDTRGYIDNKDIVMLPSVSDIVGLNRLSKRVLSIAAGAITGMVAADPGPIAGEKPLIGLTLHGDLMPCMYLTKKILEEKGYEVVIFAAVGSGGKTFEELIDLGVIDGAYDLVTHEIVCHLFEGLCDAGPSRLEAAGKKGIPQIVIPGKVDVVSFSATSGVPVRFKGRKTWMHNPDLGVVRLNKDEMSLVADKMVEKLNQAIGPTTVVIPVKGLSSYGKGWEAFYDEEADFSFFNILEKGVRSDIRVVRVDAAINDELFAKKATDLLHDMMKTKI